MNNKLSIIVPVYNSEALLDRCIKSILSQDYGNFELIIVNDGSTDYSMQICEKYALQDDRVKLINKQNEGSSIARNIGLDNVTGDYIFWVDSDDYVSKDFCSTAVNTIERNPNIDILIFGFETILKGKEKKVKHHSKRSEVISKIEAIKGTLIDGYINSLLWNKVFRASLFNDIRFPEHNSFDDVGTTYKVLDKADNFYIIPEILYFYEINEGSQSTMWWHSEKKTKDYFNVRYEQLEFIKKNYPTLIKEAYVTTGFAALMQSTYVSSQNNPGSEFLIKEQANLKKSAFPYLLLFRIYYCIPQLSKKIVKAIFK